MSRKRNFISVIALLFLLLGGVAVGWFVLHARHGGSLHSVVIHGLDKSTGQPLSIAVEFPPSRDGSEAWMPNVDVKGSDQVQLRWADANQHVVRIVSANHAEKEIHLAADSSGDLQVRLAKSKD